jgi:hypothetical protein
MQQGAVDQASGCFPTGNVAVPPAPYVYALTSNNCEVAFFILDTLIG